MKRSILFLAAAAILALAACKKDDDKNAIKSFTITSAPKTLLEGETYRIKYEILPEEAEETVEVLWSSSNESVATVSDKGRITALAAGRTTITGTVGRLSDSFDLKVMEADIEAVEFIGDDIQVRPGIPVKVDFTTDPEGQNPERITWEVEDESVARCYLEGRELYVEGFKLGESTTLTASIDDNELGSTTIYVLAMPVESVTLNATEIRLQRGETFQLEATVTPEDADDPDVTWKSSNTAVATVTAGGLVTLVDQPNGGYADITATAGGKKATCRVQEDKIDVTEVTLNKSELKLALNASETLVATVTPSDATYKTVTWTSSNSSAVSVTSAGKVTMLKTGGTATITATADGKKATCRVSEYKVDVTKVTISGGGVSKDIGETVQLTATVTPSNATYNTVTWTSSNTNVATVSNTGLVTINKRIAAVIGGSVTITATADGKSSTTTISVKKPEVIVDFSTAATLYLDETETRTVYATAYITPYPTDFPSTAIEWSVNGNTDVHSIARYDSTKGKISIDMNNATTVNPYTNVTATINSAFGSKVTATKKLDIYTVPVSLSFKSYQSSDFGEIVYKNGGYIKALPYWNKAYPIQVFSKNGILLDKSKIAVSSSSTFVKATAESGSSYNYFNIETARHSDKAVNHIDNLTFSYTVGNGTKITGILTIMSSQLVLGGYCTTAGSLNTADTVTPNDDSGSFNFRRVKYKDTGVMAYNTTFARLVTVYLDENYKAKWVAGEINAYWESSSAKQKYSHSWGDLYTTYNGTDYKEYFIIGQKGWNEATQQRIYIYSHPHDACSGQDLKGDYYSNTYMTTAMTNFIHTYLPAYE